MPKPFNDYKRNYEIPVRNHLQQSPLRGLQDYSEELDNYSLHNVGSPLNISPIYSPKRRASPEKIRWANPKPLSLELTPMQLNTQPFYNMSPVKVRRNFNEIEAALIVLNLPSIPIDYIYNLFSSCGNVTDIWHNMRLGQALVRFQSYESMKSTVKSLNGIPFFEHKICLKKAIKCPKQSEDLVVKIQRRSYPCYFNMRFLEGDCPSPSLTLASELSTLPGGITQMKDILMNFQLPEPSSYSSSATMLYLTFSSLSHSTTVLSVLNNLPLYAAPSYRYFLY